MVAAEPHAADAQREMESRFTCGRVSRAESLALMRGADVNVLVQTVKTGADVIAGKTFEYLAAGRPVLAVVDPRGGDAWLLKRMQRALSCRTPNPLPSPMRSRRFTRAGGRERCRASRATSRRSSAGT